MAMMLASPKVFYRWGWLLSATLIRLRSRFNGDFDQYLIYLVFILNYLSYRPQLGAINAQAVTKISKEVGLNTLSISDITEIPRETARRKLRLRVAAGYLRRRSNQLYYLDDQHDPNEFLLELAPLFNDVSAP